MKKLNLIMSSTALAITIIICCLLTRTVSAQGTTTVLAVEGPSTVDPAISETFNVSVVIYNVPDPGFYGWEFWLSWTPGVINCTKEVLNLALWEGYYLGPWDPNPIKNDVGKYHQSLTGRAPGTPDVGTFWLVNLTFKILVTTPTDVELTLSPPEGSTYCIADIKGDEIPHSFQNLPITIVPELGTAILPILIASSSVAVLLTKKSRKNKK